MLWSVSLQWTFASVASFYFHVSLPPGPHSVSVPVPGRPLPHPQDLTWVCMFFRSTLTNLALLFPAVIGHSVLIVLKISKGYYRLFETNPLFLIGIYSIYSSLSLSLFPSAEAVLSLHRVWPIRSQILHRQQSQVLRQRLCWATHTSKTRGHENTQSMYTGGKFAIWCTVLVSLKSPSAVYFCAVTSIYPPAARAPFSPAQSCEFQQETCTSDLRVTRVQELLEFNYLILSY